MIRVCFICHGNICRSTMAESVLKMCIRDRLYSMLRIAVPSVLQQSTVSIGMMIVQAVVNPFGTQALAGYTAVSYTHLVDHDRGAVPADGHDGRVAQQAAAVQHVAGLVADGGDDAHGGGLAVHHADGGFVGRCV